MSGHTNITALMVSISLSLCLQVRAGLTFSFNPSGSTPQSVLDGFTEAGNYWSNYLTDNVTVYLDIDYQNLGASILGSASSTKVTYTYSNVKTALGNDAKSANDSTAVSSLSSGSSFDMLINYTSNSPLGSGSATPYLDNDGDANNTTLRMTVADAKALGLMAGNDGTSSGSITFNSTFAWDFDRSNGISGSSIDFVGVAVHEIGHMLGVVSGVDILDTNSSGTYFPDSAFTYVSVADLYRYSNASIAYGEGTIDWTANTTNKYFSIDGGTTPIKSFATGVTHGDGRQASHWKDGQGIGVMDPTIAYGELATITNNDLQLLDVIGWDLSGAEGGGGGSPAATPEPVTLGVLATVTLAFYRTGRCGKKHRSWRTPA